MQKHKNAGVDATPGRYAPWTSKNTADYLCSSCQSSPEGFFKVTVPLTIQCNWGAGMYFLASWQQP